MVRAYLSGETRYGLAKRYDISRNLIRIWLQKHDAGGLRHRAQRPARRLMRRRLLRERLVDTAKHRVAMLQQGDQCTLGRHAAHEGAGAVDRIDDPDILRVVAFAAKFLANDAMIRCHLGEQRAHGLFGRAVGCGDGIEASVAELVVRHQGCAVLWQDRRTGRIGEPVKQGTIIVQRETLSGRPPPCDRSTFGAKAGRRYQSVQP